MTIPSGISLSVTDVIFSLTTTCADLYLSDVVSNPGPSSSPFQVYASTQPGSDLITITGFGDELHAGAYWVGIALSPGAASPCAYSLSVSFDTRQQVTEGMQMPQAAIAPGVIRYFDFYCPYFADINWRVVVDLGVQTSPIPVSIYGTANNPSSINFTRPAYPYPVPGMPSTYKVSTTNNGSSPVTVLTSQATSTVLVVVNTCTGVAGCYITVAVFAPFGGPGIPAFTFEMSAFSLSASKALTNGTAVNGTLAADSYQDFSFALTSSTPTANCQLNVTLASSPAAGSPGLYLCVVKNTGETFVPDASGPDCDWFNYFLTPSSYFLAFNASTPQLTGSPSATLNNVGSSTIMVGTYLFLLVGFGGTSGVNASYSIQFVCYPYTNTAKPSNLPLTPSVPVSQTIDPASTAYFVVDLSAYNVNATTDVSIYITSSEARSPTGSSPVVILSFSQNISLPSSASGSNDYTVTPSSSALSQTLLTQASYSTTVTLSAAPLYIALLANNPKPFFGSVVYGSLSFTILVTVTQRVNLTLGVPFIAPPSPTLPFHWFNVYVPTTVPFASLVVSLSTSNITSGSLLQIYSSPTKDPLADTTDFTRAVNAAEYPAGGFVVFNNESCVVVASAYCRYSILVYTPTPTGYVLLATNAASAAPPAAVATLTPSISVNGLVGTAGTLFYQFYVPYTAGTVNVSLTSINGNADLFLAAGSASTTTYVDPALSSLNPAVFYTNGSSPVKLISFTGTQWSALATTYNVIAPNLQGWYDLAVFGQTGTTFQLLVQVIPSPSLSVTPVTPLQNGVQKAGAVSNTGVQYFSFTADGSLGSNVDIVFLVQPDTVHDIPAAQTLLTMQISTTFPFSSSFWKATAAAPFASFAFTANSQTTSTPTSSSCSGCYNPALNQTYYIAVSPSSTGKGGGPFLITVTYAQRIAMPSSASTVSGSLLVGAVQTYTYVPTIVSPSSLYVTLATAGAPGQAALFYSAPSTSAGGVTPFSATSLSGFSSVQQQTIHVATSCSITPSTNCVYYFQVLALTNIAYTFTLIDQVTATSIIPGVPTTLTSLANGYGCSLVNFVVPVAHVNATISFSAAASSSNVSVFVSSSVVSSSIVFPDALQNYWFANAINLSPLTITATDRALHASSTYSFALGTSGTWTASVCSQSGSSVTITAGIQDITVTQQAVIPFASPSISGVAAAGNSSYATFFVGVFTSAFPTLNFTLTSASLSSLVLYVSPSFNPGPTVTASFTNFTNSIYETSSITGSIQLIATSGRVKLTRDTTYYVAVYNTASTPTPFTLTASYSGLSSSLVTPSVASLCVIFYSLPGNIDYPWSSATSLSILYDPTVITTSAGTAVTVLSGNGTRTFTNRFGNAFINSLTIAPPASAPANNSNLLYLASQSPVDAAGLSLALNTPIQLAGNGPAQLFSLINWFNQSGIVIEGNSFRVDGLGSAFLSTVPGFLNVTVGAGNVNALAPNYGTCQAPISFTNGLRPPTQPSVSNGAMVFTYSYSVSDGVTYVVSGNLTITCTSQFASLTDQLGNPYQIVTNVQGTRLYTYLPNGAQILSTVSGLSEAAYALASQRFYPYALLSASPGVYTMSTAPFLDHQGVEFNIVPSAPVNGLAPGVGVQYNATTVYFTTPEPSAVLTEGYFINQPLINLQYQLYTL